MKNKDLKELFYTVAFVAFVLFVGFSIVEAAEKPEFDFSDPQYLRTIDGDTFKVSIHCIHPIFGQNLSVRLKGIDVPELYSKDPDQKKKAIEARGYVESVLTTGKDLRLKNCIRGSLSRIICDVSNSLTKDLGADLVKKKWAHAW